MSRVQAIIFHEAEAERLQGLSDEHRWLAARLIAEELEAGKSKAQLGREIGKSEAHVRYMARAWEAKLKFGSGDPFNEIYNSPEVRGITRAEVPEHDLDEETAGSPFNGKAEPLFPYGPAEALKDWQGTVSRIEAEIATIEADSPTLLTYVDICHIWARVNSLLQRVSRVDPVDTPDLLTFSEQVDSLRRKGWRL